MSRLSALKMIKRRARQAGLPGEISAHSFRGTGITEYLRNGGDIEVAARIAGHESTRTTQLYNRLAMRRSRSTRSSASTSEHGCVRGVLLGHWCPRIEKQATRARRRSGNDPFGRIRSSLTASIKMGEGSARGVRASRQRLAPAARSRRRRGSRPHSPRATMGQ